MPKVYLRELERSDLLRINVWRNNPEIIEFLGANFLFISSIIDERWFESYLSNRDKSVRLAIVELATDKHIGNVSLTSIHPINRSAEFSIFIGDKNFWSAGYGLDATKLMLSHGFNDLNLHRIYLTLLNTNERALRMYRRIGFCAEGCQREAVFKNGLYCDVLEMALLKSELKI